MEILAFATKNLIERNYMADHIEIESSKMYSYRQIARNGWLRVGDAGVYNLVRSGRLRATNVSSGVKYKKYAILGADIISFIQNNQVVQ